MKKLLIAVAANALFLTACGGSICDRAEALPDTMESKAGNCDFGEGSTTEEEFDKAQCNESISNCTSEDEEKLNAFFDCLEGIDECVAGQEEEFGTSQLACFANVGNLTPDCASAVFTVSTN